MLVRSVLHAKNRVVVSIEPTATVATAVELLVRHNIGSLPVVETDGRLVGIFTERDVLRGLHRRGDAFCHAPIAQVMTSDPVCCEPNDTVHDAIGRMSEHQIGQLPVVHDDQVVGLVSVGDLVRVLHEAAEEDNQRLLTYVYGAV